jgi:hypothetical protein
MSVLDGQHTGPFVTLKIKSSSLGAAFVVTKIIPCNGGVTFSHLVLMLMSDLYVPQTGLCLLII